MNESPVDSYTSTLFVFFIGFLILVAILIVGARIARYSFKRDGARTSESQDFVVPKVFQSKIQSGVVGQSSQILVPTQSYAVFISYRRTPSAMLATLIAKELERNNIAVFVDTRQQDGAGLFPRRLLTAIQEHEIFVCLLADSTFESEWVLKEIEHAHLLGKTMIPVFQESYNPLSKPNDPHVDALLQFDGVKILDRSNLYVDEAISRLVRMVRGNVQRY